MNIHKYKNRYLKMEFYNLNFFGYGRHTEDCKISGHYTIVLDKETNNFVAWKHGDYQSLISIKKLPFEILSLNESERKCLNDIIHKNLNCAKEYKSGMCMGQTTIFECYEWDIDTFERCITFLNENKLCYKYEKKFISNEIQYNDIVKDIETGEIFKMTYEYDWKYIQTNERYQPIRILSPLL